MMADSSDSLMAVETDCRLAQMMGACSDLWKAECWVDSRAEAKATATAIGSKRHQYHIDTYSTHEYRVRAHMQRLSLHVTATILALDMTFTCFVYFAYLLTCLDGCVEGRHDGRADGSLDG